MQLFLTRLIVFLQAAGNAVKRASDNLVKAAQKAAFDAEDDQAVVVKSKMVGGIAQVRLSSQEEMNYVKITLSEFHPNQFTLQSKEAEIQERIRS